MERDFYHFVENVYGSQQGAFRLSLSHSQPASSRSPGQPVFIIFGLF